MFNYRISIYYICPNVCFLGLIRHTKPHRRLKEIFIFLISCFAFLSTYCQSNNYIFSRLDFTNGLSNDHITSLYKDHKGFMWFGTMSGLNRFDGYQFKVYKRDSKDSNSLGDNYIQQVMEGPDDKLWIETGVGGFNIYDFETDRFDRDFGARLRKLSLPEYKLLTIVPAKKGFWFVYEDRGLFHYLPNGHLSAISRKFGDPASIDSSKIAGAKEDGDGNIWVIHQNGLLEKIDAVLDKVVYRTSILEKSFEKPLLSCSLYVDGQNDLWVYSNGLLKGVYYYNPSTRELKHLSQDAPSGKLNSNLVYHVIQDSKGQLWVATDHGGVNIIDKKDFSVKTIEHAENDPRSLVCNCITSMYKDSLGTIWLGTSKNGICYYHQNMVRFPQYKHQPFNPASLSYDDINSMTEDAAGNIWMGSNGGGLIYFDRLKNSFRQFRHDQNNTNSLCNNILVNVLMDKENRLWIGSYFGGLDCYDGKTFKHYKHNDQNPTSLADDRVMCIYEDSDHQLWIGTLAGGMDRLDVKNNVFYHYNSTQPNGLRNNYVSSIAEDAHKNLWIATAYGIDELQKKSGQFIHYSNEENQLSSNNVISLFIDSRQHIWAGTREGLSLFLPDRKRFQTFRTEDGLCDNTIRSILEDHSHNLWIGTSNGLSKISTEFGADRTGIHLTIKNYGEQDGLQGREFNDKSGLLTKDGTILFGGTDGFNIFRPENIVNTENDYPIVLTGLEIFNKSVQLGERMGDQVILSVKHLRKPKRLYCPIATKYFPLNLLRSILLIRPKTNTLINSMVLTEIGQPRMAKSARPPIRTLIPDSIYLR